ncbi:FtsX-like permease family protein [Pseudovibrio sp. W64]|uniref:ABC transporter permease n=1 Tax=Pseudovibrio TaxID=258255 RepID=UPI0007AE5C21|nr:ABC transporter permease [Pseudovibrio sp. W64]KZK87655.1 FtsX-like permease family protein [Pseudovibrio sp. W64]
MSSSLKQTLVMTKANLLSLPRRLPIAASMALSISLVVCVLSGFLSMATGFEKALQSAGSTSVAVILGGGTNQENGSEVPADALRSLEAIQGDIGVARDATGNMLLSKEIVIPVQMQKEQSTFSKVVALRGMDPTGPTLRDGITLSEGRLPAPGAREIVVGKQILANFPELAMGRDARLGPVTWTVVGHFTSGGSAFESEIWTDFDAARSAFDRMGEIQSVRLRLADASGLARLQQALGNLSATPLAALTEADLYASQSDRTATLIRMFGWPLALLMAIGATAGALNTMMSSLSDRKIEVATLRALGFGRIPAFLATWVEAMVLATIGVGIGLLASWLLFNGWQASTVGSNDVSISFQLTIDRTVMLTAGVLGLLVGVVGGALPALSATRLPVIIALRAHG